MDGFELFLFLVSPSKEREKERTRERGRERVKESKKEKKKFNYRIEGSNYFSLPWVTAAVIAFVFLKMKCHTLSHSAVINESAAHIHPE